MMILPEHVKDAILHLAEELGYPLERTRPSKCTDVIFLDEGVYTRHCIDVEEPPNGNGWLLRPTKQGKDGWWRADGDPVEIPFLPAYVDATPSSDQFKEEFDTSMATTGRFHTFIEVFRFLMPDGRAIESPIPEGFKVKSDFAKPADDAEWCRWHVCQYQDATLKVRNSMLEACERNFPIGGHETVYCWFKDMGPILADQNAILLEYAVFEG
jgi:hypothetical protein